MQAKQKDEVYKHANINLFNGLWIKGGNCFNCLFTKTYVIYISL